MLGGDLAEPKLASHPGIREDDVEGSALGLHRRVESVEVGLIRDRALHRAGIGPEVGHGGVERFLSAAEDEDDGALLDEALCRGAADAGSAAGDDCNLTFKLSHHFLLQAPSLVVRGGHRDARDGLAGVRRSARKRAHRWCKNDPAGRQIG